MSVEGKEHILAVEGFGVDVFVLAPSYCAALARGQILNGMEAEVGKVGDFSCHFAVS